VTIVGEELASEGSDETVAQRDDIPVYEISFREIMPFFAA
jgi:hypothetical protein